MHGFSTSGVERFAVERVSICEAASGVLRRADHSRGKHLLKARRAVDSWGRFA
jgi:hypothetical protein